MGPPLPLSTSWQKNRQTQTKLIANEQSFRPAYLSFSGGPSKKQFCLKKVQRATPMQPEETTSRRPFFFDSPLFSSIFKVDETTATIGTYDSKVVNCLEAPSYSINP